MARWWKQWIVLAGGLLSCASSWTPLSAQEPVGTPAGDEFPRLGAAPAAPQGPPPHPLSLDDRGVPNGFSDEEYYPQPEPYVLKLKGEYMLWHVARPQLATTVATTSTSPNLVNGVGALGDPGTVSILGPGSFDYGQLNGGRLSAGIAPGWFMPFEISGFWMNTPSVSLLSRTSDGSTNSPVLARPFQGPNLASLNGLGQQVVLSAGFPGELAGSVNVSADMSLWGIETNFLFNLGSSDTASLDVIVGYRYTDLRESLSISNSLRSLDNNLFISFNAVNVAGLPPGFTSVASDSFQTRNQFNGGTIGLRPTLYVSQFTASADLKLAMGSTHQSLNVGGVSSLQSPDGSVQTVPGGLLAVASNSGLSSRDAFTIIPEMNVNIGFNITRHLKIFGTYNIFYWSDVIRPGDQLNNRVDSRQVPTDPTFDSTVRATQPGRPFVTRDFWGQGFSVGVEIGF